MPTEEQEEGVEDSSAKERDSGVCTRDFEREAWHSAIKKSTCRTESQVVVTVRVGEF